MVRNKQLYLSVVIWRTPNNIANKNYINNV